MSFSCTRITLIQEIMAQDKTHSSLHRPYIRNRPFFWLLEAVQMIFNSITSSEYVPMKRCGPLNSIHIPHNPVVLFSQQESGPNT